jgi:magnesium transporter
LNPGDLPSTAGRVRVRLYDADARDREVPLTAGLGADLGDQQLLWIDVDGRTTADLGAVAAAVGIADALPARLITEPGRADLTQHPDHIHLTLVSTEPPAAPSEGGEHADPVRRGIDVIAGRNWVVTVHDGPVRALARIEGATEGETRLGALDAAGFLTEVTDEVLVGYFELVEEMEREIDQLDEAALRRRPNDDVLDRIVALRRRIGEIRRTLAPHRAAFAALARPEMELHEELGKPWPGLAERLERAIEGVQGLRDLLLGTFDIHMGRAARETNDVMKVLTLLSAVLLPSVVLAGVMGMNFKLDFFESPDHFGLVIGAMVAFSVSILAVAKWRHWL